MQGDRGEREEGDICNTFNTKDKLKKKNTKQNRIGPHDYDRSSQSGRETIISLAVDFDRHGTNPHQL